MRELLNWAEKLTGSGDLTLEELRTMAARQQQQIEAQQQLLMAREQRLKFLKQQEARHHQGPQSNDTERLRHLREKVEAQELKLRRLRALRGQVGQQRANNSNLTAELDSVRALFNEKEKELSVAVAKVEELTKQLEELRQGNLAGRKITNGTTTTAMELKKLRQELVYRANLTEQQNARIAQQRETLSQRQEEITLMDQRIRELQQRLHRKRVHNQQLANHIQAVTLAKQSNSRVRNLTSNVAAVEPVKRVVQEPDRSHDDIITKVHSTEGDFAPNKKDPKYQTLPYNTKFPVRKEVNSGRPEEPQPIVQNGIPAGQNKGPVASVKPTPPQGLSNLAPRPYGTTYNSSLLVSHLPSSRNQNLPNKSNAITTVPTQVTKEQWIKPAANSIAPSSVRKGFSGGPPVTSFHRQPPPRPRQPSESPSHSTSEQGEAKPLPSKSPSKPLPPPRLIHCQNPNASDSYRYGNRPHTNFPHPHSDNKSQFKTSPEADRTENSASDQNANLIDPSLRIKSGSNSSQNSSNVHSIHITLNRRIEMPPAFLFPEGQTPPADLNPASSQENESHASGKTKRREDSLKSGDPERSEPQEIRTDGDGGTNEKIDQSIEKSPEDAQQQPSVRESHVGPAIRRAKKGNLKTKGSAKNIRRVSFDPLALLLDAALEGEVELVRKTTAEVTNPSAANDEGITALHNAICAGHFEIVRYLVEYGCDVNAQDSDGWTPLHCAASCNNLPMVKYLVEHGACIFATTLSDHETAAEKCEEDEEGFDGCSEYLYSVQEKLGILNAGVVYAVYDYDSQNPDELSFHEGDKMVVLRKGDEMEREWWWTKLKDREGYVPRNLLGLYPRISSRKDS
ncbi:apoptosis-stimulating of p53 protein 1-like isoform X1 [Centruroides sculpturatus]|uniref:apoptosis-stimulating of p53 protein 1-like isoform X1 n=1 Tax=Centruroides sculpturatus TaxID=218467 RepID=UPI000C6CA600|nr:apoptosis-stimulating of p53 protein 1-like isoform X1 [Centruroides sculpturatus]